MDIRELIVNDPVKYPERLNATYERIEEVIRLTLDEKNARSRKEKLTLR